MERVSFENPHKEQEEQPVKAVERVVAQQEEKERFQFNDDELEQHFGFGGEKEGIITEMYPGFFKTDYEYGPGEPDKSFYESKHNTEAGLLWALKQADEHQRDREEYSEAVFKAHTDADGMTETPYDKVPTDSFEEDENWSDPADDPSGVLYDAESKNLLDYELYFQRAFIIKQLGKVGTHGSIDALVAFMERDHKSHAYTTELAQAFNQIDSQRASEQLLSIVEKLREEDVIPHGRFLFDVNQILYRLDLGPVPIEKSTVSYMGKRFDLRDENGDPITGAYVERLSESGIMGVYDAAEHLIGRFSVGDLTVPQNTVEARVHTVPLGEVEREAEESSEELRRRQEVFSSVGGKDIFNSYKEFQEKTGQELPFSMGTNWFIHFFNHADEMTQKRAVDFIKRYGREGLDSFTALEHDGAAGSKLLAVGESPDKEKAKDFFRKYGEVMHLAHTLEFRLNDIVKEPRFVEKAHPYLHDARRAIIKKSNALLDELAQHTESSFDASELSQKFEQLETETLVLLDTFRVLKSEGLLDLDDLRDTSLEVLSGADLSGKEDRERMMSIIRENYASYPERFQEVVVGSLEKALENETTRFYLLKHKDQVVGYDRFDEVKDHDGELDHIYFGSFNVDLRLFGGSKMGEAIFEASLNREAERGVPIEADCDPLTGISQKYIEWGFVTNDFYDLEGVPSFHIRYDERVSQHMRSKHFTRKEIIEKVGEQDSFEEGALYISVFTNQKAAPFDLLKNKESGYLLTRYFNQKGKTYCVFERPAL